MPSWNRKIERARRGIAALRSIVSGGRIPRADWPWRGAHVVVVAQPQPEPMPGSIEAFYGLDREIVTEHVLELSWLFERLWDGFGGLLDGCTKVEFFGRLEIAANRAIAADAHVSAENLCDGVLGEAAIVLAEMSAGTFDYLVVAPSRTIKADFGASWN